MPSEMAINPRLWRIKTDGLSSLLLREEKSWHTTSSSLVPVQLL
jgi:hypothetical protein